VRNDLTYEVVSSGQISWALTRDRTTGTALISEFFVRQNSHLLRTTVGFILASWEDRTRRPGLFRFTDPNSKPNPSDDTSKPGDSNDRDVGNDDEDRSRPRKSAKLDPDVNASGSGKTPGHNVRFPPLSVVYHPSESATRRSLTISKIFILHSIVHHIDPRLLLV